MAILWCGSEDIDFPYNGPPSVETAVNYRSPYCRVSLCTASGGSATGFYSNPFPGGAVTSCWLSFYQYMPFASGATIKTCGLSKNDSSNGIFVYQHATAGKYGICKYDVGTFTSLAVDPNVVSTSAVHKMDFEVIDFGASATLNLYIDGNLVCTYTGDPRPTGINDLDRVSVCGSQNAACLSSGMFVADEDTRLLDLVTHYPNAAGDTNDWTGAYTAIDETTLSVSDVIYTDTVDDDFQCNLSSLPVGNFSVKAVKIAARVAGSQSIKIGIKSGGTIDVDSVHNLYATWRTEERLMQINPITSAAFTPAEIDALQINFRMGS